MGTAVMMYVLPMMLGQTYDLGKDKTGLQIYPSSVGEKAVKIQHYFTDSQYRMVENAAQIKDFLDISGKLSLKIKSGLVDVSGEGQYVKDSSSKTNGLEILIKVHFETVTLTIPTALKPNTGWSLMNAKYLGTHYCRSITYGGDLVASIRISASNNHDLQNIKGALNAGVNAGEGSFSGDIKAKLEMLKSSTQDSSSMEINYYASVPIHGVTYDIDGLMKLIDDFPNHVKNVNGGTGTPLRMELYPLSSLKADYPTYLENRALQDELEDLESQFDDLREARRLLGIWTLGLPPIETDEVQKKIKTFRDKINNIYATYMKSIAELDIAQGASLQPIKDAFEAYKDGDYIMPQKFVRLYKSLVAKIYEEAPELKPKIGGAQYFRWGSDKCGASADAEATVVGVMSSSEALQDGGSSDYICSPLDPHPANPKDYFKNYDPDEDDSSEHLLISPIRYRGTLKPFGSMMDKPIACARCRIFDRTTVLVKPAARSCPEHWTKEYEGYLMAPGTFSPKALFICMDKGMKQPGGKITFGNVDESHLPDIQEVSIKCGSLPCGPYEEKKPIPCVVCTI